MISDSQMRYASRVFCQGRLWRPCCCCHITTLRANVPSCATALAILELAPANLAPKNTLEPVLHLAFDLRLNFFFLAFNHCFRSARCDTAEVDFVFGLGERPRELDRHGQPFQISQL